MTLSCKEVTRLVSQGLDKELPADEQRLMRAHFAICRGCQSVSERMGFLRRAMKALATREGKDDSGKS